MRKQVRNPSNIYLEKNGIPVTRFYTQILLRLHECFLIRFLCYVRILISVSATIFHRLPSSPFPFFHNFATTVNIVFSNIPGDFSMPSIHTVVFYNITFPYSFILCVTLHSTELAIYKHTFTSEKGKSFVILVLHDIMKTLTSEYKWIYHNYSFKFILVCLDYSLWNNEEYFAQEYMYTKIICAVYTKYYIYILRFIYWNTAVQISNFI